MIQFEQWEGFEGRIWKEEVNVRDFIQKNYTPYDGDESFLAGPTEATDKLWGALQQLQKAERAKGGVLDMETEVVSSLTSYGPGYIDENLKDLEQIVGLQTDKPLKRAFMPYGGIKMAEQACTTYGYQPSAELHKIFTDYTRTHNQAVFDAYTPEMKKARHTHIITGLPDTYGRGRIVGDYRRVALYGIDALIQFKHEDLANCGDGTMTDDVIRLREEIARQISALKGMKKMAEAYGYDISQPAKDAKEACQWLYLRYLGQQLKLSRTSGKVLFADREEIPEFDTVITVYNMFYYAKEHPALGHAWGKYVDDDKPGCQQQTETAHCTREGCTATDTEDRANFGPGGNPLPHKYTTYKGLDEILGVPTKYKSTCDYGCGTTKEFGALDKDVVVDKTTQGAMDTVKVDDMTADERANQIIDDALKAAQEAVKQAKTKKEAIAALDQISATVKSELSSMKISVGKLNKDVSIDPKDLENILKPLDTTIDSLKGSLDDSFLSQETITSLVNKLATDVPASTAPETGIKKLIYNTVYDAIYNLTAKDDEKKTTDSMPDVKNMVLQLVSDVAKSDEGWNTMTDALVDDAVELALDEVMKDKTYAMLLKTKLGASTVEEVRAEVKKQLVNDPTFMNSVRAQVQKAADEASKGVSQGWSDQKVLDRLQANLLPISGLVANKIDELGSSAGNIADNKVDDTVHKFLPGKLGDWVSDKVGNKVNNIVQNKVNDLGGQVTDLIDSFIKQFTCGKHEYGDFEILKNPTCTEKGQKGKICKKCGKITEKTDIDAAGHTPVTDPAVAPTETTDGLTEGSHCSVCGAVLTAQEVIPMLDPTIDTWFSRAATTEADAKAAGFDSVDAANAALDAALTAAGFDPANAEHFTVQVNSSIGVLPNDRFSESGVTGKLTLPEGTRGKTAQTYYAVQMFTADTRFHKAGDVVVTPVSIDTYAKTGLQFTVYSEAVMAIAWKAQ